jgi:hypothetical protein
MTNITPVISSILIEAHSADPIPATYHSSKKLDAFLQEAYRIVFHPFTRFGKKLLTLLLEHPYFVPPLLSSRDPPTIPLHRASSSPP